MSITTALGEQRRTAIVEFVAAFWHAHGYGPSVRDVAAGVGLHRPSGAEYQIQILLAAGVLERTPRAARSLRVVSS